MKIIFLTRCVPPSVDGIGQYTRNLAESLRKQGIDASIFTSTGQRPEEKWIYPVISDWSGGGISKVLKEARPDWISFQYVPQLYGAKGLCWKAAGIPGYLKRRLNCKVSVTFHEFLSAWKLDPRSFLLAAAMRLQTLRLLSGCDAAVTTCAEYARILKDFPGGKTAQALPVGANIPFWDLKTDEIEKVRQRYGIQNAKVFAVFGRLASFRNTGLAVESLSRAREQGVNAVLLLIGCVRSSSPAIFDEMTDQARSLGVEKYMVETGEVRPEEVSKCLSASDVFLFPQQDGISTRNTTVISALAHGLPVISFKPRAGNFEGYQVPFGQAVPEGDSEGFVKAAVHFIRQQTDLHKREENRACAADCFAWPSIAQRYLSILKNPGKQS